MNDAIEENIDIEHILQEASARWDGGYVITGLLGSGDLFAFRDPHGIRPAFYYASDEVIVVASERPGYSNGFRFAGNRGERIDARTEYRCETER